jgi:sulfate transport system permease protein
LSISEQTAGAGATPPAPAARRRTRRARITGTVGPLGIGVATLWLSLIVLLPLAALAAHSLSDGFGGFWDAVTAPAALATLRVTVGVSIVVVGFGIREPERR